MSEYRLKIKIGEHEFEADGPAEAVTKQFADFKELVAAQPPRAPDIVLHDIVPNPTSLPNPEYMTKLFRSEGRTISLTANPANERDAVLLILLGQKETRENETVTGGDIKEGLALSGFRPPRVDRILERLSADGLILISGSNRGKKYRLSNPGLVKAQALASELQGMMP